MILRLALAAALGVAAAAQAHSSKEIVTPAENASVAGSPPAISMEFDSAMRITQISVTDSGGKAYALSRTDRMQPVENFSAAPETLPPGDYTVQWRGISLDGHPMEGGWSFSVK
ncbi:MAG: copper resistance CopC family protein [Pseudomonadales bacterium]|jgi:methionine-rich copper-binding protein CopC|nr:copper resistance CopC family protein [Pseudomonadales bacterium]